MKVSRKIIALTAAALAVCMMLASCSAQKEDNGVAYEKDMKISAAADLEGKAVAVQLRSPEDALVSGLTNYPKRYSDMKTAVQDLVDKKVAAVVVDANYAKKLTDGVEGVEIVEESIGKVEYRFLLNQSDAKLAEKFNAKIAALKESEDYQPMVEAELVKGQTYRVPKDDAELKKTCTLVIEPVFHPFAYEKKGAVKGFFAAAADAVTYGCGSKLDTKTVDPLQLDDTASVKPEEFTTFVTNEAQTVKGTKGAFCVVASEATEEDKLFVTTDSFYTSELVMIVRTEEKK